MDKLVSKIRIEQIGGKIKKAWLRRASKKKIQLRKSAQEALRCTLEAQHKWMIMLLPRGCKETGLAILQVFVTVQDIGREQMRGSQIILLSIFLSLIPRGIDVYLGQGAKTKETGSYIIAIHSFSRSSLSTHWAGLLCAECQEELASGNPGIWWGTVGFHVLCHPLFGRIANMSKVKVNVKTIVGSMERQIGARFSHRTGCLGWAREFLPPGGIDTWGGWEKTPQVWWQESWALLLAWLQRNHGWLWGS